MYKLYTILLLPAVKLMNGNRGRMVTQGGHGFLHALWDAEKRFPEAAAAYKSQGSAFKVTLSIASEDALMALHDAYAPICGVSIVQERGTTLSGSINERVQGLMGLGLGPIHIDQINADLADLKGFT